MSGTPPFPSPTKRWHTTAQPATDPTRSELSAKGKSVLITGGGNTGIGGETARSFAKAGASRIAILGRREGPLLENKALIEKSYPAVEVVTIPTDVTKQGEVDAAFSKFAGDSKIDVIVHAAADAGPVEGLVAADGEAYLETIQVNLAGSLWVAKAFLRHAAADAVAIEINSWAAHLSLNESFSAYCAAKLAVFRLWDTVAIANPNLSIFHTQPGVILTEMNLRIGGAASFKDVQTDDLSLPATFNVWLASREARFLKGKFLWCNWDVEELKTRAEEIESGTELNIGLVGWPWGKAI